MCHVYIRELTRHSFTPIPVQEQLFDVSVTRQWVSHVSRMLTKKAVNFVQSAARLLWSEHDERGFYKLDLESMSESAQFYVPAKSGVLWRLSFMTIMQEFFSDEIQVVKDMFDGTDYELDRD